VLFLLCCRHLVRVGVIVLKRCVDICNREVELLGNRRCRFARTFDECLNSPDCHTTPLNMRFVVYFSHDTARRLCHIILLPSPL